MRAHPAGPRHPHARLHAHAAADAAQPQPRPGALQLPLPRCVAGAPGACQRGVTRCAASACPHGSLGAAQLDCHFPAVCPLPCTTCPAGVPPPQTPFPCSFQAPHGPHLVCLAPPASVDLCVPLTAASVRVHDLDTCELCLWRVGAWGRTYECAWLLGPAPSLPNPCRPNPLHLRACVPACFLAHAPACPLPMHPPPVSSIQSHVPACMPASPPHSCPCPPPLPLSLPTRTCRGCARQPTVGAARAWRGAPQLVRHLAAHLLRTALLHPPAAREQ